MPTASATFTASLKSVINGGKPFVRYRLSRFKDVMTLLLHEKPLKLHVNADNGIGSVATNSLEAIGEEEP